MSIAELRNRAIRWAHERYIKQKEYTKRSYVPSVRPGLFAWARQWQEAGLINLPVIECPNEWTHPDEVAQIEAICRAGDWAGLKQWWFNYLKEQEIQEAEAAGCDLKT